MKKKVLFVAIALVLVATVIYVVNRARAGGRGNALKVSGNIEVTSTDLAFKIPGRVVARPVDEGEEVHKGELVAKLDSTDLEQRVAMQHAEVDAASAALAELEAGSRKEDIAQAAAQLTAARAEAARLEKDEARQQDLLTRQVISQREFDVSETALATAKAKVKQAREAYLRLKRGPRRQTIEQARARVDQARQALALAETELGYATLRSPISGVVLSKNVEPGEFVAPGTPVVTVADLSNVYLRAYVSETNLGRVHLGQSARISVDSFPGKTFPGRITFISSEAEFTPKTVQTTKERVKLVYRIKITIPNPNHSLKPGMPADATLQEGPQAH